MRKVTIIDYGIGNLRSIEKAFQSLDIEVLRTDRPDDIASADRLVFPGVGAFGACIGEVQRRGLVEPIRDYVGTGRPFLGVCVGMQLLFDEGEEMGTHSGLGILPGKVVRFSSDQHEGSDRPLKVPHMGWNAALLERPSPLAEGLPEVPYFYFVHSYHALPAAPSDVLATTTYGLQFPAIVNRNNVFGVQFHPEKSQRNGLRILDNFTRL